MRYYRSLLINAIILVRESIAYFIRNSNPNKKKETLSYADRKLYEKVTDLRETFHLRGAAWKGQDIASFSPLV